ncbi:MAG TPA: amino acid ABC transporter permease [Devosiaceae bacterium]|nr:amino acid ABC transporter permease [Devosiaceae bacterium]
MSDIQAQTDLIFVREQMLEAQPPPRRVAGPIAWVRANLFASFSDALLTLCGVAFLAWVIPPLIQWALVNAAWSGEDRTACVAHPDGACWAFVEANFGQFIYGLYPDGERWRVDLFFALLIIGLVPFAIPAAPFKRLNLNFLIVLVPVSVWLLVGGFGLPVVETARWGGLMLTIVVALVGIVVSLPLGIVLALGRRSDMPVIRLLSIVFIEFCRGVPLITVLFMASVMLPLFLPPGVDFDKLLRALIGVALFASAYMAEVIRGGLQAVPAGQYEGARALGLRYWQMMRLVILPQALRIVIPGIVNTFIGLFKDTSLVYIISLFELLGVVRQSFGNPVWASYQTPPTGLFFAAVVFWLFCFGMSQYSQFIERRLSAGRRG